MWTEYILLLIGFKVIDRLLANGLFYQLLIKGAEFSPLFYRGRLVKNVLASAKVRPSREILS